jgi:hypothetical protein
VAACERVLPPEAWPPLPNAEADRFGPAPESDDEPDPCVECDDDVGAVRPVAWLGALGSSGLGIRLEVRPCSDSGCRIAITVEAPTEVWL